MGLNVLRLAWSVLLVVLLGPIVGFVDYALGVVPGAGPQGGEVMAVLGLLYWLLWQAIAFINWGMLRRRGAGSRGLRLLVLTAPVLALALVIAWIERGPAIPAGLLVAALLGGSQLWAVWAARTSRA